MKKTLLFLLSIALLLSTFGCGKVEEVPPEDVTDTVIEQEPLVELTKLTLEQALQEYAMQIVPGDSNYFGWKPLDQQESGESGTAYGILLFHSESGSPLIYSEKLERYCSAIYSTYLLPVSVSYENDTNGSCVIIDCWMPSKENYEQDILDRFPPEAAGLVLEKLDQYTAEIIEEIAEHNAERVKGFFPGGPIWPAYSFDEALDNTSLCGLAAYYPIGDFYYEPVWNEVLCRFQNDSVALLKGLSLCNEETKSAVRSFIVAEVGASKLEARLLALESNHEDQAHAEQINTEVAKPAAPPTDEDIRVALAANHAAVEASHMIVPDVSTPFRTEGWLVLAEESTATTHTFYLLTRHAIYDLLGSGTQTKYEDVAFCDHATTLTFLLQDGRWQLSEYWLPGDGTYYEADIREKFPQEAVDKLFGDNASLYDSDVIKQCDEAAVRYYAQLTNWVPVKTFLPSDVEFSGQTLYTSADTMTYEERLAWAQAGEDNGNIWPACTGQYSDGEGCIAYVEKIVAGRYPDLSLHLRFADGTKSESLPLPRAGGYDTALPEAMEFRDGKFVYEITFPTEELTNEGQTLIHLKGAYQYEVDLNTKTISLTVLQ